MKNVFLSAIAGACLGTMLYAPQAIAKSTPIPVDVNSNIQSSALIQAYDQGDVLVFDLSSDLAKKAALMGELGGIAVTDAMRVYLKKTRMGPAYLIVRDNVSAGKLTDALDKFNVTDQRDQPSFVKTKLAAGKDRKVAEKNPSVPLTGATATVTLLRENMACALPKHTPDPKTDWEKARIDPNYMVDFVYKQEDYCAAGASVEINYKIDMTGSKAIHKTDASGRMIRTENAKYVIVTVSPAEGGGTGWHLSDELRQEATFATQISPAFPGKARGDFVGPFANKYRFWISQGSASPAVRLIETYPHNGNASTNIGETRGITAGITGTVGASALISGNVGASINTASPPVATLSGNLGGEFEVSGQLQGNVLQNNVRNVSFSTSEYTVENKSSSSAARWTWNARIEGDRVCDYLRKKDLNTCFGTLPLLDDSWIIDKNKFSAMSYANFTPSFQAIFKADKGTVGTSTFTVGTSVETGTLLGRALPVFSLPTLIAGVLPKPTTLPTLPTLEGLPPLIPPEALVLPIPNILKFTAEVKTGTMPVVEQSFTVDWSSPYFYPEQNIRLQAGGVDPFYRDNSMCLTANAGTGSVTLERCIDGSRTQVWGYDAEEKQFKSRAKKDTCLAAPNEAPKGKKDSTLEIVACSSASTQKWVLNADGFLVTAVGQPRSIQYYPEFTGNNGWHSPHTGKNDVYTRTENLGQSAHQMPTMMAFPARL
ncbi:leukocidin family pore-forming toxin [Herbaspirillum sp. alder98]|uniref:leukocidin family pore-forming toxin n=1 Tax=Herbaspirillum sp. alder98 TaxID=2913096 RepID=UPI001CD8DD12|nr:leukocidin family pore-forming toxin [Herbaspirillum sp. alder98]MCA1322633.1 leukocidin family pore-forming toxin [Herbaspirillum sp. alder98]